MARLARPDNQSPFALCCIDEKSREGILSGIGLRIIIIIIIGFYFFSIFYFLFFGGPRVGFVACIIFFFFFFRYMYIYSLLLFSILVDL